MAESILDLLQAASIIQERQRNSVMDKAVAGFSTGFDRGVNPSPDDQDRALVRAVFQKELGIDVNAQRDQDFGNIGVKDRKKDAITSTKTDGGKVAKVVTDSKAGKGNYKLVPTLKNGKMGVELQDNSAMTLDLKKKLAEMGIAADPNASEDDMLGLIAERAAMKDQLDIDKEVKKTKALAEVKSQIPTAKQKEDLSSVNAQLLNIQQVKTLADKIPAGRIKGSLSGLVSSVTGGEKQTDTRLYLKERPAYAVSLYRALTGDTRLSDADAKSRALPLLWHPTEASAIREGSFARIEKALQTRKQMIEEGRYQVTADGDFITPLADVLAEADIDISKPLPAPEAKKESTPKTSTITKEQALQELRRRGKIK